MSSEYRDFYPGRRVMVTGGRGFIGSNLARQLVDVSGSGRTEYVSWPLERKAIDIGSFYAASSKFKGAVGRAPTVSLREGLQRAVAFYRQHCDHYVDAAAAGST